MAVLAPRCCYGTVAVEGNSGVGMRQSSKWCGRQKVAASGNLVLVLDADAQTPRTRGQE